MKKKIALVIGSKGNVRKKLVEKLKKKNYLELRVILYLDGLETILWLILIILSI